jgi:RHS repeat-associated protein
VGKIVAGVSVQGLLWLDRSKIAAELDGVGNTISRFVYAKNDTTPDLILKNGVTYLVVKDHLGGPRLVVDAATGQVAQRMDYDAWGRVILDTNPGFQPFGFAGGQYDAATGLVRFGARDYDPAVGRWTTRDPILFSGGDTNLYGYVVSDPINFTDRGGLTTFECRVELMSGARDPKDWKKLDPELYHTYLCVVDDEHGTVQCGGQGNEGSDLNPKKVFWNVPGVNDSRAFNRKTCKIVDRRQCFDDCVKDLIDMPRPDFNDLNIMGGMNCQGWVTNVVGFCKAGCGWFG